MKIKTIIKSAIFLSVFCYSQSTDAQVNLGSSIFYLDMEEPMQKAKINPKGNPFGMQLTQHQTILEFCKAERLTELFYLYGASDKYVQWVECTKSEYCLYFDRSGQRMTGVVYRVEYPFLLNPSIEIELDKEEELLAEHNENNKSIGY